MSFVPNFNYLGYIIDKKLQDDDDDDDDIYRKFKFLFTRSNIGLLIRRLSHCSFSVKLGLFRSFCIRFYKIALWKYVTDTAVRKLKSAYVKCLKMFLKGN